MLHFYESRETTKHEHNEEEYVDEQIEETKEINMKEELAA